MVVSVHQPQYWPWLGYFNKIAKSDCFVFLDRVQYKHREFQNRNRICTASGWIWLTVPVLVRGNRQQLLGDVRIDTTTRWQEKHFNALQTNYGRAPFFNTYIAFLEDMYLRRKWEFLSELNIWIIQWALGHLGISARVLFESQIGTACVSTQRIIELCQKTGADTYLSGSGGKAYLQEEAVASAGITLRYQDFHHPQYQQHRERSAPFEPHMALIDVLVNEGPRSRAIVAGSGSSV